jgi:hypothetical protein
MKPSWFRSMYDIVIFQMQLGNWAKGVQSSIWCSHPCSHAFNSLGVQQVGLQAKEKEWCKADYFETCQVEWRELVKYWWEPRWSEWQLVGSGPLCLHIVLRSFSGKGKGRGKVDGDQTGFGDCHNCAMRLPFFTFPHLTISTSIIYVHIYKNEFTVMAHLIPIISTST